MERMEQMVLTEQMALMVPMEPMEQMVLMAQMV